MPEFSVATIQSLYNGKFNGTKSGTVTDSTEGPGTFSTIVSHQDGTASFDQTISYANGTTVERKTTITQNADGTLHEVVQRFVNGAATETDSSDTSLDGNSLTKDKTWLNADGSTKSSTTETITANTDGTETVDGTFTGVKGKISQINGAFSQITGGTNLTETITNAAGKSETLDDQITKSGNTTTNIYSGVNFAGVSFSDTMTKTLLDTQKAG